MKAIQVSAIGEADNLRLTEMPDPHPSRTEIRVRLEAAGVNFIDIYHRTGLYALDIPFIPGREGVGIVDLVGKEVRGVRVGDRVAWMDVQGAYAERIVLPPQRVVKVPPQMAAQTAAALLQLITAHFLASSTYKLGRGDHCLIHAAAGGVGHLLVQIAKLRGAVVFATAGGPEKSRFVRSLGADYVVDYTAEDFKLAIEDFVGERPFDVVYDGVGASTFDRGLELLRPRGTMVAFGNASGPVPPVDPLHLSRMGSLYLTRPSREHYVPTKQSLRARARHVFSWIANGDLRVHIGSRFPLARAAEAHRALESRTSIGKVLLHLEG